jgi:hypothetical protein
MSLLLAHSTVKFEDVPVNDEIEPVIDFESPIYVKRYVPAAIVVNELLQDVDVLWSLPAVPSSIVLDKVLESTRENADSPNHSPRSIDSTGSEDLSRDKVNLLRICTLLQNHRERTVLVLDQLYIVDGCESVRTVDHCPEISWSTVRKVPSSLKLFYGTEVCSQ